MGFCGLGRGGGSWCLGGRVASAFDRKRQARFTKGKLRLKEAKRESEDRLLFGFWGVSGLEPRGKLCRVSNSGSFVLY